MLPEQIRLHLLELRDALGDAVADPPKPPPAPSPPLDAETMKQLSTQRPDLAKRVADRSAELQQRTAEAVKAQDGLREVYADALARVSDVLRAAGGTDTRPPRTPLPVLVDRQVDHKP